MTKKELVQRICRDCQMTRSQASRAMKSIARNMALGLGRGERVQFSGLGSFSVGRRRHRSGRDPQTGHGTHLRRRNAIRFTADRVLQRKIS
ncbi:MAG TPA: HU family DNA-binding protein [Candidatus Polarisedimenticolia bacterium]|nr:HU family DNA-binding protein [Candidatus Polarisedimenticolia bacterium]